MDPVVVINVHPGAAAGAGPVAGIVEHAATVPPIPQLQASAERAVRSPLAELGWTKQMIRDEARRLGLPTWEAPAAPCLSSRIQYGLAVTPDRLQQVEKGEAFLRDLGLTGDLRVRHHGDRVRIEVLPESMARARDEWAGILAYFKSLGLAHVELDPRGYRRGALLAVLNSTT